jgi:hypothetical protein
MKQPMRKVYYHSFIDYFHVFVYVVEQANLPQDITIQFTGINFVLSRKEHTKIYCFRIVYQK